MGAFYLFILACFIILLPSLTGKVGMGFQLPHISRPLPKKYKLILKNHFPYYNKLELRKRKQFEKKVQYFIHIKEFIPRHIDHVTDEMKVLISACAVQLTFGYPKVFLSHFKRILIYPDAYYSTINNTYHKGEVNPRLQAIVLSWKSFVHGYLDQVDGINLGLHEMAHALRLENMIFNEEVDFLDHKALDQWHDLAALEIDLIRAGNSRMFRDYAATDQDEFFSIAIENFFERPEDFRKLMPKLYEVLSQLLKQDPYKLTHAVI